MSCAHCRSDTEYLALLIGPGAAVVQLGKLERFARWKSRIPYRRLVSAQHTLIAVGVEPRDVIPLLSDVENVVKRSGEGFESTVEAVARLFARGRIETVGT